MNNVTDCVMDCVMDYVENCVTNYITECVTANDPDRTDNVSWWFNQETIFLPSGCNDSRIHASIGFGIVFVISKIFDIGYTTRTQFYLLVGNGSWSDVTDHLLSILIMSKVVLVCLFSHDAGARWILAYPHPNNILMKSERLKCSCLFKLDLCSGASK